MASRSKSDLANAHVGLGCSVSLASWKETFVECSVFTGLSIVPDVLHEKSPDKVAFLQFDLNVAQAEMGALEVLFDKIVPGGFIVFDDFGHILGKKQNIAERAWMGSRDYGVLDLSTCQGLVIKR